MNIELIWAQDRNGGIGKDGKLPWKISEDLKNFKKITLNSTIIMGRKTWDSLPFKPLPDRRNIILSSNKRTNVESYSNIGDCLNILKSDGVENLFVIGGRSIYEIFYPNASMLHLTMIDIETGGIDTFFPISMNDIKKDFIKIENTLLAKNVTYTKWVQK